jgi:hypothetical protein
VGPPTSQNHIGLHDILQGYALQKTQAWYFVNGVIRGPPSAGISIERKVEGRCGVRQQQVRKYSVMFKEKHRERRNIYEYGQQRETDLES